MMLMGPIHIQPSQYSLLGHDQCKHYHSLTLRGSSKPIAYSIAATNLVLLMLSFSQEYYHVLKLSSAVGSMGIVNLQQFT